MREHERGAAAAAAWNGIQPQPQPHAGSLRRCYAVGALGSTRTQRRRMRAQGQPHTAPLSGILMRRDEDVRGCAGRVRVGEQRVPDSAPTRPAHTCAGTPAHICAGTTAATSAPGLLPGTRRRPLGRFGHDTLQQGCCRCGRSSCSRSSSCGRCSSRTSSPGALRPRSGFHAPAAPACARCRAFTCA